MRICPLPSQASAAIEHTTGRSLAREAAAGLGRMVTAIPRGTDRAPVWPVGLTGSIAHADGLVVAVVGERPDVPMGLGIDLERQGRVGRALGDTVLTAAERRVLAAAADDTAAERWITLAFCVKEACAKALFPHTGELLEFEALELEVGPGGAAIPPGADIRVLGRGAGTAGWRFSAFAHPLGHHLVAGAVVRRSGHPQQHRPVERR